MSETKILVGCCNLPFYKKPLQFTSTAAQVQTKKMSILQKRQRAFKKGFQLTEMKSQKAL